VPEKQSETRDPVGAYFGRPESPWERLVRSLMLRLTLRAADLDPGREIPLAWSESPFVEGLRLFERSERGAPLDGDDRVLVGTVRMGFGHHRIAYSAYTWALAKGATAYLHDLLAIESEEADAIRRMDATYSRFSRISADLGGPAEWLWGRLMQQGNLGSLRLFTSIAEAISPLMSGLPRDVPVVASYPLNGQIAVACGFERVINLVVDNYPQHFTLVPGALNLVQSPYYHARLLEMGMPADAVAVAGHWVSHDLASNATADSAARIARAEVGHPRRLLVPVGGAGAQRRFLTTFVDGLSARLKSGKLRLILNAGDHAHMRTALEATLERLRLDPRRVGTLAEVRELCRDNALDGPESSDAPAVVLCAFDTHFEAFSATDLLMRMADVLVTKPSELAFFPIPKLHIRRVGNHEAASALRAAELGDGTPECRTVTDALRMVSLLCDGDGLFVRMNEDIAANAERGIYDGSRVAVERALAGDGAG